MGSNENCLRVNLNEPTLKLILGPSLLTCTNWRLVRAPLVALAVQRVLAVQFESLVALVPKHRSSVGPDHDELAVLDFRSVACPAAVHFCNKEFEITTH